MAGGTRCYSCMKEIKRFHKPHTCPECKRAFCSNCFKYEHPIKKNVTVCLNCHRHTTEEMKRQDRDVIHNFHDRYYKPVEQRKPITYFQPKSQVDGSVPHFKSKFGFTDPIDLELEKRWKGLSFDGDSSHVPTDQELRDQLQHLKGDRGQEGSPVSHKQGVSQDLPPPKTASEEANNLMQQAKDENALEGNREEKSESVDHESGNGEDRENSALGDVAKVKPDKYGLPPSNHGDDIDPNMISSMIRGAQKEVEEEEKKKKLDRDFISEAERKLGIIKGLDQRDKGSHSNTAEEFKFKWMATNDDYTNLGVGGDSGDEDVEIQKLIEQMVEESKLEQNLEAIEMNPVTKDTGIKEPAQPKPQGAVAQLPSNTSSGISYPADDLPWCCICNDDAAILCRDCDNDLYCMRCFKQGHEQFNMYNHHYDLFDAVS